MGDPIGAYRRHGRRYSSYSLAIGAGLVANVVNGRLAGFGLEPCTSVVVSRDGHVVHLDRRRPVLVWAGPLAGAAAAAAGAVATGVVLRSRRAA
jgi:hypothetical protein